MSFADRVHTSPAHSSHREPSVISTRIIFGHQSPSQRYDSLPTNGSRSPTPMLAPVKVHRDVSTRFGMRLKQLRTERNLTQVRMAREFGLDRSYISDLERGRKSISLPTMEIFALGLKLSLAELLTGI